jgi:glyoxylase-like metal-dependent hydrolase (beta-lactamase superfamily II)
MAKSPLIFPFGQPPERTEAIQVAPGVRWLRMPLPFKLDHINLWLIEEAAGWAMIDTGLASQETRDLWEASFPKILDGRPISRIICTHFHPDHMGLAGWHAQRWGVDCWASLGDWAFGRMLSVEDSPDFHALQLEFYRQCGFGQREIELVRERGNPYSKRVVPPPPSFCRLKGGTSLMLGGVSWRLIEGNGHSPEHISLYSHDLKLLISGDQILPKISPIVGVWPQDHETDQLGLFLATLDRFRDLPADTLVLPSHGLPFKGLHDRLDQLAHHHDQRLLETLEACRQPQTAAEMVKVLFKRELDMQETIFAASESLAHLHYLTGKGLLAREEDAQGIWLWRRA